jgi:predicted acetyltransferase
VALIIRRARADDFPALQQMLELYQYELSDIWHQDSDGEAKYGYELGRYAEGDRFHAYVALHDSQYAGFALVAPAIVTRREGMWMDQFFILKRYRLAGAGEALAHHVFATHPGPWEIGQMQRNVAAQAFWRKVIAAYTRGAFTELHVTEGWWQGVVQQFEAESV